MSSTRGFYLLRSVLRATELLVPWQGRQLWRALAERALTNWRAIPIH